MEIVPKLWDDARRREKFTLHFRILKWRTLWCKMRKVFDRTLFSSPFFTSQGSVLKKSQRNVAELKGDKTLYIRCNFKTSQNGGRHNFLGAALHPKCAKKVRITLCKMLQFGLRKCNFRSPKGLVSARWRGTQAKIHNGRDHNNQSKSSFWWRH